MKNIFNSEFFDVTFVYNLIGKPEKHHLRVNKMTLFLLLSQASDNKEIIEVKVKRL